MFGSDQATPSVSAKAMTVTPIEGEPWRAHVSSQSRPGHQWLVELTENAGIGFCGSITPSTRYAPQGKAPSRRDQWRADVAQRREERLSNSRRQ